MFGKKGNGTLGNGPYKNVSGETGHFYHLGNGTFYSKFFFLSFFSNMNTINLKSDLLYIFLIN